MATSIPKRAWKDIRWLAASLRGLLELEDELTRAGSIDALIAEKETRLAELQEAVNGVEAKLAAADQACADKVAKAQAQVDAVVAAGSDKARAHETAAQKALGAVQQANVDAQNILNKADTAAAALVSQAKQDKAKISTEAQTVQAELDLANIDLAEAVERKAAVEAEIERLKRLFTR